MTGTIVFLRVPVANENRTRIFSFLACGPDMTPEIRQAFRLCGTPPPVK